MRARQIARLNAIRTSLHPVRQPFHASSAMTFAKPADSLKEAKVISRDPLPEPKWVQIEGLKWQTPDGKEKM